ncbi:MAG: hypothetical protein EOP88_13565 [Verrucomicrobiaceae bacterium]|nr:MAG: hypothetical protein EOP88_13565 [Verrucomicrobiaceae bacterium]
MTSPKILSVHSISLVSIGLVVGLACGWSLGRGPDARAEKSGGQGARLEMRGGGETSSSSDGELSSSRRDKGSSLPKTDSKDLAQAVRAIFRETVKAQRIARFEKLVERAGIERMPELVSLIRENDLLGNDSGGEWSILWTNWSQRDPMAAMDFLNTFDWTGWGDLAKGEARNRTITNWAQADPEKAVRFVEGDAGFMKGDNLLVFGLVEGWANVNPEAAAAWLFKNGLAQGPEHEKIVAALRREGGQEGLEKWFFGLDPATVPDKDLTAFARSVAPDKTAAWIEQHRDETWMKNSEVVSKTALTMAQQDPQAAVQWAVKTGLGDAMHFAVYTWCEKDMGAASTWVEKNASLSNGGLEMVSVVMAHLNHKDPASAREWAAGISDEPLRDRVASMLNE